MRKQRGNLQAVQPQPQIHVVTEMRDYSLITPLVGGGAIAGKQDEVTVIRGTEIRGLLRFWWRACYGGRYSSLEEMKQAEEQIWGSANSKGASGLGFAETIQIIVEPIHKGNEVPAFREVANKKQPQPDPDIPEYAAFPLQLTDTEPAKFIYKNVRFHMTISFPKQLEHDIRGTLWSWETFGGVGARTRRGFGALKLNSITSIERIGSTEKLGTREPDLPASNHAAVKSWITRKFNEFEIDEKAPDGVPSLSKDMLKEQLYVTRDFRDSKDAWKLLIEKLCVFRQDKQWPDSREIKKLRDAQSPQWKQKYQLPKAAIGLPIVFHFPKLGKQADLTLQGAEEGHDRLASSLILRPLLCQNGCVGLVILLENYPIHPEKLQVMKKVRETIQPIPATIQTDLAVDNVQILKGENDILKAFMNYLKKGNNNTQRGNTR
jgi:CRISPR-associated protein Cmr1